MATLTLEELKERIEASNAYWKEADVMRRRVLLAQDVLNLFAAEKLDSDGNSGYVRFPCDTILQYPNVPVQEWATETNLPKCYVCVRGALFLARLLHNGQTPLKKIISETSTAYYANRNIASEIESVFDRNTQNWMELYFEGEVSDFDPRGNFTLTKGEARHARQFDVSHHPETRIRLIMENVIANGGHFVPEQLSVDWSIALDNEEED